MRFGSMFLMGWTTLASALIPFSASAVGSADGVALQYHFAGTADLAGNTNFGLAKKILSLPPARHFQDLVLDRLAGVFWNDLQFDPGGDAPALLRPMLNDLLAAESVGSFGGRDKDRMDFVLAARLDAKSAAAWQKNLETALHGQGESLTAEGFSGRRWNRPGRHALWILRARDWVVAGGGDDLLPTRDDYLRSIKQDNRPAPMAKDTWLSAEVDWPFLAAWVPLADCPLKLARTMVDVTAGSGRMRATAYVSYPEAVPWQAEPWRVPKELVSSPLSSFTAARNLAPYLKANETLARLSNNPLTNQLFCWALREMALQTYAAWPVADATNTIRKLGTAAPALLNPFLEARDHTQLAWNPQKDQISWTHLQLTGPTLKTAHDENGDFLLAEVFPVESKKHAPVSDQLLSQFEQRDDLVYYDWELTGMRLMQWRLLTELLPVFPPPTPADTARQQKAAQGAKPDILSHQPLTPLAVTEAWLAELSGPALNNTVTEVTRTSPTELTIVRNSQFLFTGLESVLLSHWLADAPVGPIDYSLLPMAKMSGPGMAPPPSLPPPGKPPAKPPPAPAPHP
jgi:hypothetical protein